MHLAPIDLHRPVPVFPLPNCVLLPGAVQPLHIFEPRYRAMMREVTEGRPDSLPQMAIALAFLKPGWEKTYYGCPDFFDHLCLGHVIAHEQLPDGKYNLLLQGVCRAKVLSHERRTGEWGVYRVACLQEVRDVPTTPSHETLQRRVLQQLFTRSALKDLTVTPSLAPLFEEGVSTSRLIDGLAFALVQDLAVRQRLLEEPSVGMRGELLLQELVALAARLAPVTASNTEGTTWPPSPSLN